MYSKPVPIEAALLFGPGDTPDPAALLPAVAAAARRSALSLVPVSVSEGRAPEGEGRALFTHEGLHLILSARPVPLPAEGFSRALASPVTGLRTADYAGLVAGHRGHIFISVGDGPLGWTEHRRAAPLDVKIMLLYRLILEIAAACPVRAVHWCQSDMLFAPDEIAACADLPFPVGLVTHPQPFSPGTDARGRRLIGLRAQQSQMFCDKPLVLEASEQPIERALTVIDFLILQYLAGTVRLADGDVYALPAGERLEITHVPPRSGEGTGHISVRIETGPQQRAGRTLRHAPPAQGRTAQPQTAAPQRRA